MDREPWFEPKSFGYGAGVPIHPKGWVLLGVYTAALLGSGLLLLVVLPGLLGLPAMDWSGRNTALPAGLPGLFTLAWIAVVLLMTLWLLAVARRRTRGGWRWRWGGREGAGPPPQ